MIALIRLYLALLWVLWFLSLNAVGQDLGSTGSKFIYAGIPQKRAADIAVFGKQRSENWCWAACIQMVLNFHSIPVTQEQIVRRTLGKMEDAPANHRMMFEALDGWEVDAYGRPVSVGSNAYSTSIKEIRAFVSTNKPLIVGLGQGRERVGHAFVLIGMYHAKIPDEHRGFVYAPYSVLLLDPWPSSELVTEMSWSEFVDRLIVSYKVWVN